jgi:hypothetical protein
MWKTSLDENFSTVSPTFPQRFPQPLWKISALFSKSKVGFPHFHRPYYYY